MKAASDFQTFADLFAGIGGFRLGLESLGMRCVFSCENDPDAAEAYKANFGDDPSGDVRDVGKDMPDCDVICGGFPCQTFSLSGRREGMDGDRGNMFLEVARIAAAKRPKAILLENVPGILSYKDNSIVKRIQTEFWRSRYVTHYKILNAAHYGIGEKRTRVYFMLLREDINKKYKWTRPFKTMDRIFAKDVIQTESELGSKLDDLLVPKEELTKTNGDPPRHTLGVHIWGYFKTGGQTSQVYHEKGKAYCASHSMAGFIKTARYVRRATKIDRLRLMGFKDSHVVSKKITRWRGQISNAVVPKMVNLCFANLKPVTQGV